MVYDSKKDFVKPPYFAPEQIIIVVFNHPQDFLS